MTHKIAAARQMRIGAERLRKIATRKADAARIAEMMRIAQEMDEHADELERSVAREQRRIADNAVA